MSSIRKFPELKINVALAFVNKTILDLDSEKINEILQQEKAIYDNYHLQLVLITFLR